MLKYTQKKRESKIETEENKKRNPSFKSVKYQVPSTHRKTKKKKISKSTENLTLNVFFLNSYFS